jgi:hypothetical protein
MHMGEIVAAIGTCHTPYLFTRPPDENPQQLDQAAIAMRELGQVLDETKPDVILFLGSDHVETFSPTCIPTFCIIAGSRAVARFAGRELTLPVHREMAEDILSKLVTEKNFDMAYSEDAELGHAFAVPFDLVIGKRDIPAARSPTSSRGARSASRSSRAAACRISPARRSTCTRSSTSIGGWCRSSRQAMSTRCST